MVAVSGQRLANLTKETLKKIRTDQSFDHSHANVARKSEGLLGEPRFQVMLKEEKISCFDEISLAVLKFPGPEKKLIQEVQTNL